MLTLYISVCRLRVWSFSQLTRMIIAQSQHGDDQNTQINFVHSSSPLHDLLTTPTSTTVNTTPNKSRSFQARMQFSTVDIRTPLPALLVKLKVIRRVLCVLLYIILLVAIIDHNYIFCILFRLY